jgi:hypothetical protein
MPPRAHHGADAVGDGTVRYGEIARIIDAAKGAGVERVGIVTDGMRREATAGREGPVRTP